MVSMRLGRRVIEKDDESDRPKKLDLKTLQPPGPPMDMRPQVKQGLTLAQRVERLDKLRGDFNAHNFNAKKAAEEYYQEYQTILDALATERERVGDHLALLDKIEAQLPVLGGKDEKAPSNSAPSADDNTGDGEDTVSDTGG